MKKIMLIFALALAGIAHANIVPVIASISGPGPLLAGTEGTWHILAYDPDAAHLNYSASWGDGSSSTPISTAGPFLHSYANIGNYTAVFTVIDDQGASASASVEIQAYRIIEPDCPGFAGLKWGETNKIENGQYTMFYSDISENWSATNHTDFYQYHYAQFGLSDGLANLGYYSVYKGIPFQSTMPNGDQVKVEVCALEHHIFSSANRAYMRLTVNGVSSQPPLQNLPPVITGVGGPTSLYEGVAGTWQVAAYDPDGNELYYSVQWGDETIASATDANFVSTATFQHTYSQAGNRTITFSVKDSGGAQAQASISVEVQSAIISEEMPPEPPAPGQPSQSVQPKEAAETSQPTAQHLHIVPHEPIQSSASSAMPVAVGPAQPPIRQPSQLDRIEAFLEEIKQILLEILNKL